MSAYMHTKCVCHFTGHCIRTLAGVRVFNGRQRRFSRPAHHARAIGKRRSPTGAKQIPNAPLNDAQTIRLRQHPEIRSNQGSEAGIHLDCIADDI